MRPEEAKGDFGYYPGSLSSANGDISFAMDFFSAQ
jgi:hypothetical protein